MANEIRELTTTECEFVSGGSGYISSTGRSEDNAPKTSATDATNTDVVRRGGYISSTG